jgi:lipid-binding SYLF domain-containing protein
MRRMLCAAIAGTVVASMSVLAAPKDQTGKFNEAATVLREIHQAPDKGIPNDLWTKATCVAVFPSLKKAAFIIGGEYGKGVMSCRTANGWSSPVFMELEKGSWGFQAGAQEIDLVLLVTDRDAAGKMLNNKVSLGADASVAAGPVGRAASASTTGTLATVLSYSRSKGLFAGINLSGGALKADKDSNTDAYSNPVPADVLNGSGAKLDAATSFLNTLGTNARATSGTAAPAATDQRK